MRYRLTIFAVAVILSVEMLFDIASNYDPAIVFWERAAVAVILLAGLTFFWFEFSPPKKRS
jgi:hypothetical protein